MGILGQPALDRKVRTFSLAPSFLDDYRGKQPKWGYGGLGYFVYKRTYSRLKPDGTTEEFWETCQRVVEGCFNIQKLHCRQNGLPWNEPKAQKTAQDMFERMWAFKFTPPGRGLWVMGTDMVLERGSAALMNCSYISTHTLDTEFAEPFCYLMDMSMLGVGVGGDTRGAGKVKLVVPKTTDIPHVVPDTREGWVDLVRVVLESFAGRGSFPTVIDFSQIRPKGAPIKGFGGVSSGPDPLCELVKSIITVLMPGSGYVTFSGQLVLTTSFEASNASQKITSTQIADVFNLIGRCVVAGNIRRSAEILYGHPMDKDFMNLKNPEDLNALYEFSAELDILLANPTASFAELQANPNWQTLSKKYPTLETMTEGIAAIKLAITDMIARHPLLTHRWASNNSIFAKVGMDYSPFVEALLQSGEPGFAWIETARQYGRMIDPPNDKDYRVMGTNPCVAGDTLIAVADGRNVVPIAQLVAEGKDVPVYSMHPDTGEVSIKWARNPRMTQESAQLVEIVFEGGYTMRTTLDHKMALLNGSVVLAKDLQPGDSLPRFQKEKAQTSKGSQYYWKVWTSVHNGQSTFEHRAVTQFHNPEAWANLSAEGQGTGWHRGGIVVHHKNFNGLDNSIDNLEVMSFKAHQELHAKLSDMAGSKNPMWGRTQSLGTRSLISKKALERWKSSEFRERWSASWPEAQRQQASLRMSAMRHRENLAYYKEQETQTDLKTLWVGDVLHAQLSCEICETPFIVPWGKRGQSYCSISCANKSVEAIAARKAGQRIAFDDKARQTQHDQIMVYKDLIQTLGRLPMKKEWQAACKERGVSYRFQAEDKTENPNILHGYKHLKQVAVQYNHRVKEVRLLADPQPVYNMTVEENHTFAVALGCHKNSISGVFTYNCGEMFLDSAEYCNLSETYPAHHDSLDDYKQTLKVAYLYAKTVTLLPSHNLRANAVAMRNRRIGCSMSGIVQAIEKFGYREFLDICDQGYHYLEGMDRIYSEWLCVPRSIKMTTTKPSGSVSLLSGATPGIHFPHSEYYLRRVRVEDTSPLVEAVRAAGYPIEVDAYSPNTLVVSFPIHEKNFSKSKSQVTVWEQFALAAAMQAYWADNSVSVTVTFKPDEAKDIQRCLEVYETQLKSVSLLPLKDHSYVQAPYEEITKEQYEALMVNITELDLSGKNTHDASTEEKFCTTDVCEIKRPLK